jgi:hypothetical protein
VLASGQNRETVGNPISDHEPSSETSMRPDGSTLQDP